MERLGGTDWPVAHTALSNTALPLLSTRPLSSVLTYLFKTSTSQLSHLIPFSLTHCLLPLPSTSFIPLTVVHRNTIWSGVSSSSSHLAHKASSARPTLFSHHLPIPSLPSTCSNLLLPFSFISSLSRYPPPLIPQPPSFSASPTAWYPPQASTSRSHPGALWGVRWNSYLILFITRVQDIPMARPKQEESSYKISPPPPAPPHNGTWKYMINYKTRYWIWVSRWTFSKNSSIRSTLSNTALPSSSTQPVSVILTHLLDASAGQLSHLISFPSTHSLLPRVSFMLLTPIYRNTTCSGDSSSFLHLRHMALSARPILFSHHFPIPFPPRSRQ